MVSIYNDDAEISHGSIHWKNALKNWYSFCRRITQNREVFCSQICYNCEPSECLDTVIPLIYTYCISLSMHYHTSVHSSFENLSFVLVRFLKASDDDKEIKGGICSSHLSANREVTVPLDFFGSESWNIILVYCHFCVNRSCIYLWNCMINTCIPPVSCVFHSETIWYYNNSPSVPDLQIGHRRVNSHFKTLWVMLKQDLK